MTQRRRVLTGLAATGLSAALPPLARAQAQEGLKIGLNLERTGVAASYGAHMLIAAQIAVDELNRSGGTRLDFVTEDNRSSPEQAVIATRNLDRAGVFAMLGPIQSSQCRTAFPAANRANLVAISPGSGAPGLTAQNRPWTFRNAAIDQFIIDELVATLRKRHPNAKSVVTVLDPKDAYESFLVKSVAPSALEKNGFTIVNKDAPIEIPSDASDHSVFVTRLKAMNPDILLLGIQFEPARTFLREANRQKFAVPMFAGLGYVTESVAEAARDIELWAGQPFDAASTDPATQRFVAEFRARCEKELPGQYTTPTYIDAGAYETVRILADAFRAAGATPKSPPAEIRTKVRDYLAGLKNYQGLGNTMSINADGDAVKPTLLYRVQGGKWTRA
ncbi:MAG TPA: ABC transporter substrate-binding protein [Burkholderiaceae bacterium]|nr:ABC transporter substrate-binding protein [Burkholderiaceae bacterium]